MVKYEYSGQFRFIKEPKCGRFTPCIDISELDGLVKMFGSRCEDHKGIEVEVKEKIIPIRTGDRIIVNDIDGEEVFNHLIVRNKKCCSSIYDKYTLYPDLKSQDLTNFLLWGEMGIVVKMIRILC